MFNNFGGSTLSSSMYRVQRLDGQVTESRPSSELEVHNENLSQNVNSSEFDHEEATIVPIENLDVDKKIRLIEIISIISEEIKKHLLHMTKPSKYYSLILDTTPDVSHTKQFAVVIQFVYENEETNKAQIEEQFLGFLSVNYTIGQGSFEFINGQLKSLELSL
ncbi:DUF4371 domain-containing protein [Trichonephila clavipes]|uniref:DUF4371 domain-containing protein n=1 Tax=Trichonephila clavipes TaxID=2585209 RepID=A0A8X6VJC5_TRICX|nr:DUF4371 domain-containing protein [Trichonephila clavipes]